MCVLERFVSHGPTPAVWPKGGTLLSDGGPCLSGASWSALRKLASVLSNGARRGVNGFGAFCRNKRTSPAGAKTGNTEHHMDTRAGSTRRMHPPYEDFFLSTPKMDFRYLSKNGKGRTINSERSLPSSTIRQNTHQEFLDIFPALFKNPPTLRLASFVHSWNSSGIPEWIKVQEQSYERASVMAYGSQPVMECFLDRNTQIRVCADLPKPY
jgi:hypothetical protein